MNLRLQTIAQMIQPGMIVADIGTDHALLPIYLVEHDICEKCYACDVADGPIAIAKENIQARGLTDRIPVIQSDGFQKVPEDCNCGVIAGMGAYTIIEILEESFSFLLNLDQLILQANDDVPVVREWLNEKGFLIQDEEIVFEGKHVYQILFVNPKEKWHMTEEEILCGPILTTAKKEQLLPYASLQVKKIESILNKRNRKDEIQENLIYQKHIWQKYSN